MYELEQTQYDVLLLGTGLVESILAAALARAGKSVLHLDANEYYGGNWAAFNYNSFLDWLKEREDTTTSDTSQADNTLLKSNSLARNKQRYSNVSLREIAWPSTTDGINDETATATVTTLSTHSRHFNLELAPKLLASQGKLVDLLVTSDIGKYLDFRLVDAIYLYINSLELIPCSKEAVFSATTLTLIEKRKLMKFLMFAANYDGNEETLPGNKDQSYDDWLKENFKLDDRLAAAVVHAVTLKPPLMDTVSASVGVAYTRDYLHSYGRFGPSTFLYPIYGGSEIIQAFCRVCAVFGGTYILGQTVTEFDVDTNADDNHIQGAYLNNGQRIACNTLVTAIDYMPEAWRTNKSVSNVTKPTSITRMICIMDRPVRLESKKISILTFPAHSSLGNKQMVISLQLDSDTQACPSDYWILYLWTRTSDTTQSDLDLCQRALFRLPDQEQQEEECESKPRALFIAQYTGSINDATTSVNTEQLPKGIHTCSDPGAALDFDDAILEAESIFHKIVPDAEFLPRAPPNDDDDNFY
ncbi:GDP dissociation inhibitor-domain-containing protein [Syncephalis plumigaleata]|nr:GDP dissociation inhibitor-domain-containing protein [Syncephalis plumigaleata]